MPFLPPNQQRQSTEGTTLKVMACLIIGRASLRSVESLVVFDVTRRFFLEDLGNHGVILEKRVVKQLKQTESAAALIIVMVIMIVAIYC